MKKMIIASALMCLSVGAFANTCKTLQEAEGKIVSIAYYDGGAKDEKSFCALVKKAVNSKQGAKIGMDGLLMGSLEFCVQGNRELDVKFLVKEVAAAIKEVPGCFSEIGQ